MDLLLERGKIDESLVTQMSGWHHSGFAVHVAGSLGADDIAGRERLAQYMLRCPLSLDRMIRVTGEGKVLYLAEKRVCRRFPRPASRDLFDGVPRNFQLFDPLDFIAQITQHIPDTRKHLTRYFGWYASRPRGRRAQAGGAHHHAVHVDADQVSRRLARRRWAALIQRVWAVDPLVCPRCHGRLRILRFIQTPQHDVIEKILRHCGLWEESPRGPPHADHGPVQQPDLHELRYVSDLQFADTAPPEPGWTPD